MAGWDTVQSWLWRCWLCRGWAYQVLLYNSSVPGFCDLHHLRSVDRLQQPCGYFHLDYLFLLVGKKVIFQQSQHDIVQLCHIASVLRRFRQQSKQIIDLFNIDNRRIIQQVIAWIVVLRNSPISSGLLFSIMLVLSFVASSSPFLHNSTHGKSHISAELKENEEAIAKMLSTMLQKVWKGSLWFRCLNRQQQKTSYYCSFSTIYVNMINCVMILILIVVFNSYCKPFCFLLVIFIAILHQGIGVQVIRCHPCLFYIMAGCDMN